MEEFFVERTAGSGAPGKPRARDVGGGNDSTTRSSRTREGEASRIRVAASECRVVRSFVRSTTTTKTKTGTRDEENNVRLGFGARRRVVVVGGGGVGGERFLVVGIHPTIRFVAGGGCGGSFRHA